MNITISITDAQALAIRRALGPGATNTDALAAITRFVSRHADDLIAKQRSTLRERLAELDPVLAAQQEAAAQARIDAETP